LRVDVDTSQVRSYITMSTALASSISRKWYRVAKRSLMQMGIEVSLVFGAACVYGQVIKTRRNDHVVKVERRAVIGTGRLQQALRSSEDSVKLNTSFVERPNLTIRQGSAYLGRRTICQARWKQRLEDHIELFRCFYNFIRPHKALKLVLPQFTVSDWSSH
jgi:hypothetical protein